VKSQLQLTGDTRVKEGVSNQETCEERNSEAKLPKIPCYGNDFSSKELKPGSGNLKTTIDSVKFPQQLTFMI